MCSTYAKATKKEYYFRCKNCGCVSEVDELVAVTAELDSYTCEGFEPVEDTLVYRNFKNELVERLENRVYESDSFSWYIKCPNCGICCNFTKHYIYLPYFADIRNNVAFIGAINRDHLVMPKKYIRKSGDMYYVFCQQGILSEM